MKDLSSVKVANINTRPSPMGTRQPLPRNSRSGSQFFPPDLLTDEGEFTAEASPTPTTPSPLPRTATPSAPLTEAENITVSSVPQPSHLPVNMETESPHASTPPPAPTDDEAMLVYSNHCASPTSPPTTPKPAKPATPSTPSEEDLLRAHLAVAETNRSIIKSSGVNSLSTIPQFTPAPAGGFPHIHLAHAAQLFDFQAAKVITTWLKVPHPKVLIRVFDHDGKNPSVKGPLLVECLRKAISTIAQAVQQEDRETKVSPPCPEAIREETDHPLSFLAYNISEETKNIILNQRIWSSTEITFSAHPFQVNTPPLLLFCLHGFSTTDTNTVKNAVYDIWMEDVTMWDITDILSDSDIPEERVHFAARDFIQSLWVERLDYKVSGGILLPRYNIFAVSPTNNPAVWTKLRAYLLSLKYPSELEGSGSSVNFTPCPLCHSIAHPRGLCPFPNVPLWNGPKHNLTSKPSNANQRGRGNGKGRRTGA
ncbi:hypothetical protein P692DRAFT_20752186 [Suillus brevipes Sb2]|nr:hypothetical protein P692DRAFT_20752186 [Suillus brevipes Sb2]